MRKESFEKILKNKERGASLVEYALLVSLMAIVCIGALETLAGDLDHGLYGAYQNTATKVAAAGGYNP